MLIYYNIFIEIKIFLETFIYKKIYILKITNECIFIVFIFKFLI